MGHARLDLLGGFHLVAAGTELRLPTRKAEALLACLALAPDRARSRETLIGLLWGDRGEAQARHSLSQTLSSIRRAFGDAGATPIVVADAGSISLGSARVDVDVDRFERRATEGTPEALAEAAALYRGDLLEGLRLREQAFEEWLAGERNRLREQALGVFSVLLEQLGAAGRTDQAVEAALRLLALDPLQESVHRHLMRLYAAQGRPASALRQYELCVRTLRDELGVEPEAETTRLYGEIKRQRETCGGTAPDHKLAPADTPSIAVLPFDNFSGDAAQEYFVDGITEDIITALARCRWLRVVARNSSFSYRGKSADVRRIAGELGVRYLLEGSVRRLGDRVRVTAQLVDGRHGTRLWGERYDSEVKDIFDLQEEIPRLIAGTIEPELSAIEGAALRNRSTRDLNAWDCYQRGLWHLYRFAEGELEIAKDLFERAIQLDPSFAQAYARLAYVHIQLGFYGRLEDRAERIKDAVAFARTAVDLDEREPATRLSLGRALSLCGAAERGVEELRAATELDPSFAQAHFALAQVLCYLDRPEEAFPEINEALRLSPRDPHLWTFLNVRALAHYISGNLGQAEADERAALRQPNTTFWPALFLVAILGQSGKTAEATEAIADLHRFRPGMTCADALRECTFGDRRIMTERFVEQLYADLRKAGLPE